ncbi:pectinesterase family protein [Paenibacillus crassostreae]|uniref:Fibronectin type-III domain-containing protein n=1 Tax=Paenibacillus crassostreae TaxID=1763538 RepID=A0A162KN00_9BACL|nr:pectinesterase family protein [Paenibacillus crassostreae]AOZ92378.1 hypothetical protein LPB68_09140 [Paenibacillus crassostreae]OAB71093.1 hypothetical protein PNBC_21290 [Paenibacillus crassostreae]
MIRLRKIVAISLIMLMVLPSMNIEVFSEETPNSKLTERVYIVNDDFENKTSGTAVEELPASDNYFVLYEWSKDKTIKSIPKVVVDPLREKGNVISVEDLSDSDPAVVKNIPRQTKPFTVEIDFMTETFGHATKVLRLLNGSGVALEVELRTINGKNILGYSIPGGHAILVDDFQVKEWYNIRLLVDPQTQEATPIINNILKPTYKWRFLSADGTAGIDKVKTRAPAGPAISVYFDNMKVYEGIDDPLVNPEAAPAKVENVTVSTEDLSTFLKWDAVYGAASYTVTMATDPNGPFEAVVGAIESVLTYSKIDVVKDGTYYFKIEANNAKGSSTSDVVHIEVKENTDKMVAFPGAEGGGKFTTGGRGHDVYTVTTLEDYGPGETPIPGSLRDALSENNRTVIFAVSGTIKLKSTLSSQLKNVTIAGQTAPGDGITLAHYGLNLGGSENVIIRYMRFRPGITNLKDEPDAIDGVDIKNLILDHVSTSWSTDETLSVYRSENITVQWSMVSESLTMSGHEKGKHGYGGIFGGKNSTYHNNIIATHTSRNPRIGGSNPGQTTVDFNNNVIYNWGFNSIYGGNFSDVNIVNNYMKPGPGTKENQRKTIVNPGIFGSPSSWYVTGNYMFGAPDVTTNNKLGIVSPSADATLRTEPIPFPERRMRELKPAEVAYQDILGKAGATLPKRDAVDARIVSDIINETGRFINNEYEVGGYPELQSLPAPTDSDADGIPDAWETAQSLDPSNPDNGKEITASGYSNLEVYLNSLVDMDHAADNPVAEITSPTLNSIHEAGKDLEVKTNVSSPNGIEKVEFFNGADKIGEATSEPYTFTWKGSPDGTHFVNILVTDRKGNQTQSTSAPIHINSPLISDVWNSTDVGNVAIKGNTSVDKDGVITVKGSGRITSINDAFHFGYRELKGDGEFVAKINSATPVETNAIAGIMIRSSLAPDAATAILSTSIIKSDRIESKTPYSIHLSSRLANGQTIATLNDASYPDQTLPSILSTDFPYWLKLDRKGNSITAYASPDGSEWKSVGSRSIALGEVAYVGFAVESAKDTSKINNYNTAVFSDVSTTMAHPDDEVEPEKPIEYETIMEDDFSNATTDTIFTPEYKALLDDASKPMYLKKSGTVTVDSGKVTLSGRLTIGARDSVDSTVDYTPGGAFDLSEPYRMVINIADTALDPSNLGRRLQVFVDNNTSNNNNSIHGAGSNVFQQTVSTLTPGEIIIESEIGTEESFVQLRTEGSSVVVIDSIRIEQLKQDETLYLVNDDFEIDAIGELPKSYTNSKQDSNHKVTVEAVPSGAAGIGNMSGRAMFMYDKESGTGQPATGNTDMSKTFTPQLGTIVAEADVMMPSEPGAAVGTAIVFQLTNAAKSKVAVSIEMRKPKKENGTEESNYTLVANVNSTYYKLMEAPVNEAGQVAWNNEWINLKMVANPSIGDADIYVNDEFKVTVPMKDLADIKSQGIGAFQAKMPGSGSGNFYYDNIKVYIEPVETPKGLMASAGDSKVQLDWVPADGALSYNIKRSLIDGGPYETIAKGIKEARYLDETLSNDVTYYYVVTAVGVSGESKSSNQAKVTPTIHPDKPAAPLNLASLSRNESADLSWDAVEGAVQYIVKRGLVANGPFDNVATTKLTTYRDAGLSNATTYYYVVTASNVGGESEDSTAITATPITPLGTAIDVTAAARIDKIELSWLAVDGATSYLIERAAAADGSFTVVANQDGDTKYVDTAVTNGTPYFYKVTAMNGMTKGLASKVIGSRSLDSIDIPVAPAVIEALSGGQEKAQLSWEAVDRASAYQVKRSTVSGSHYEVVGENLNTLTFTDSGLTDGTTYYYVVTALNEHGESYASEQVSIIPGPLVVVAKDGSGDFDTVQAAIDSLPDNVTVPRTLLIKAGEYREKIKISSGKNKLTLIGEGPEQTVLVYNDNANTIGLEPGSTVGTSGSYSVLVESDEFTARDLTIQNDSGDDTGQAVALLIKSDHGVLKNVHLLGDQDTLYTHSGRQYYVDSYIEGDVDYIFGGAKAVFENSVLHSKSNGYITAAASEQGQPGYLMLNSRLTKADSLGLGTVDLGRPWRPYAQVVYINTWMDDHIKPAGWHNWSNPANELTARYAEYNSSGPGAKPGQRMDWSKQLTMDEAEQYTVQSMLGGTDQWDPTERLVLPDSNAQTSGVAIDGVALADFNKNEYHYKVELPEGSSIPVVTADQETIAASVQVIQAEALPGSATIEVTAVDGTVRKYIVEFTSQATGDVTAPIWTDAKLAASDITSEGVTLSWTGASDDTDVTSYLVYMDGQLLDTVTAESYQVTGLNPETSYLFRVEAGDAAGNWSSEGPSLQVTTLGKEGPVQGIPAKSVLSSDNGHDTGLLDGDYTITMNLWWGENGDKYELYENDILIDTQQLTMNSPQAQLAKTVIIGRVNGAYAYTAKLINKQGATTSDPLTVQVKDADPAKPVLSHDNWDGDGNYVITMNKWWGTNAKVYRLYENGILIDTQTLTPNTSLAQSALTQISDREASNYEYIVELENDAGVTKSEAIVVNVTK